MISEFENSTPAERLLGMSLSNGWTVTEKFTRTEFASGGNFSTSYIVKSDSGHTAFLKAMDYHKALMSPDPATALEAMTAAFNFERNLLERCKNRRLSRVVTVLDSGTLHPVNGDTKEVVQYLIFELAEGDIRRFVVAIENFDTAWTLRTLHNVAAALQQLHSNDIVHQDLKPSNVLIFDQQKISKVADLGRAFSRDLDAPHDHVSIAGDYTYAPPELLYGQLSNDWEVRRLGCDMYQFGSLIVFFITGCAITHLLLTRLDNRYHFERWGGTYSEILPYIQRQFVGLIRELRAETRTDYADEIAEIVQQLCDPNPADRGHPKAKRTGLNQYSLERYISIFDRLAKRAELSLTRRQPLKKV